MCVFEQYAELAEFCFIWKFGPRCFLLGCIGCPISYLHVFHYLPCPFLCLTLSPISTLPRQIDLSCAFDSLSAVLSSDSFWT